MKIQYLAVIFIIIILPISVILNGYTRSQVETLDLQISYDNKLNNATYDAVKTFQLNTINSDTSDLANSKLTDIEASANIFFKSIANNFNMAGYNQDVLKDYVPALVYTMYDGYYIYSPYTNTLDDTNEVEVKEYDTVVTKSDAEILSQSNQNATYKQGDKISGLKPYVSYSCRYKRGNDDFIITYSLDNYITIQGMINDSWVYESGYLLDNIGTSGGGVTYRNIPIISEETLTETVYVPNEGIKTLPCIKINGVKFYKDSGKWFSIMNEKKYDQPENFREKTNAGIKFYEKAKEFTEKVRDTYGLSDLKGSHAVDEKGQPIREKDENGNDISNSYKFGDYYIFTDASNSIEDPNSNFNQQRLAVIRYTIEKNLSIAINNYNNYSGVTTNFQMPKLKEDEWEKILNNVSVISFLQGLNIGGKIYNGYSIITNNITNEVVNEESIYIVTGDNKYHTANDKDLKSSSIKGAYLNLDFEIKTVQKNDGTNISFIPRGIKPGDPGEQVLGCYSSIVSRSNIQPTDNFYQYMAGFKTTNPSLATAYFTALGRERYSMYKTHHNSEKLKAEFIL